MFRQRIAVCAKKLLVHAVQWYLRINVEGDHGAVNVFFDHRNPFVYKDTHTIIYYAINFDLSQCIAGIYVCQYQININTKNGLCVLTK